MGTSLRGDSGVWRSRRNGRRARLAASLARPPPGRALAPAGHMRPGPPCQTENRTRNWDQTASGWAMTLSGNFEWHRAVRESSQPPAPKKNAYNTKLESEVAAWFHTKPLRLDATLYTAAWIPTCRFRIVILAGASARTDRDCVFASVRRSLLTHPIAIGL